VYSKDKPGLHVAALHANQAQLATAIAG